jgi:hypothetical protein
LDKKQKELFAAIWAGPVKQFILDHENTDVRDLVLKHKELFGIPTASILQQIASRRKAKEKLPSYFNTQGIIFPPAENFEQTSSESTALFKTKIIQDLLSGEKHALADLTGGFGVDVYFLSRCFANVHYVEPRLDLLEMARHAHELMGADKIVYHNSTAEDFLLTTNERFDLIYLDPSRRTAAKQKVYALADSVPNVLTLKGKIFERSRLLLLKASPLLDLQAGITQLNCVRKVFVVSIHNECKEILYWCEKNFAGMPAIEAVNIVGEDLQSFPFSFEEERQQEPVFGDPLRYLYEPNASILKAGAFKSVATRFNLVKIQSSTHLYTSEHLVQAFPGRKFLIEALVRPNRTALKIFFPDGKANITTRNYPLSPEELKKKTGLKDGGEKFLIGFSGQKKKFLAVAQRV